MQRHFIWVWLALWLPVNGAELKFDFNDFPTGQTPPGFVSTVSGIGKPGDWQVITDEVPSAFGAIGNRAPIFTKTSVLAQLSREAIDEHFPMLIYEKETFGDFKLTTKFKTVGGGLEQMAGIAFRIQDEKNYYVVRASSLGNTFRFYKVVNGERGNIIGPMVTIPSGVWHEMTIECKGTQIRFTLDGKELFPPLSDSTFSQGKIGFWTKSDSVSYFSDTTIHYTPRIRPAQALVDSALEKYTRLLGLKIYAQDRESDEIHLVASSDKTEIGQSGGETEESVLKKGVVYCGFGKDSVAVIMSLRDRNGDPVAAVRIIMKTFMGQTEQNAIVRATVILKFMQERVHSLDDLLE